MATIIKADFSGGGTLEYIVPTGPPHWSGEGTSHARSADGKRFVTFLPKVGEEEALKRAEALARKGEKLGGSRILWPCGVTRKPQPGIVWPAISDAFLFDGHSSPDAQLSAMRKGHLRKAHWYLTDAARRTLTPQEQGDFPHCLAAMEDVAAAVDTLHRNGMACGALSGETVLVNLVQGKALLTGAENFRLPDSERGEQNPAEAARDGKASQDGKAAEEDSLEAMQDADRRAMAELFSGLLGRPWTAEDGTEKTGNGALSGETAKPGGALSGVTAEPGGASSGVTAKPGGASSGGTAKPDGASSGGTPAWGGELEGMFRQALDAGRLCPRECPTAQHWRRTIARVRKSLEEAASHPVQVSPGGGAVPLPNSPLVLLNKGVDAFPPYTHTVSISWESGSVSDREFDMDVSAFLLNRSGKAASKKDMVFYGAREHPSHSVWLEENPPSGKPSDARKTLYVNENAIPPETARVVFVVTVYYNKNNPEMKFNMARNAAVRIDVKQDHGGQQKPFQINLSREFPSASWCEVAWLERENGKLSLKKNTSGGYGGLVTICERYGIPVGEN